MKCRGLSARARPPHRYRQDQEAGMESSIHPAATHHLPFFVTPPGETDVLMTITGVFLAIAVLAFGILFFRLHSLPEQIAHKSGKLQAEVVAVLCLVSLFTHMHIFWIVGLVLALVELPDFGTPLKRIAGSAEKLAGFDPGGGDVEVPRQAAPHGDGAEESGDAHAGDMAVKQA